MKRIVSLATAVAFALGFSASAQILYKVEKPGSDKVSYILGTHHFAPLSAVDCIESLPEVIKNVDKVYGELDMSEMTKPETIMKMQQQLMAPSDSTLAVLLTPEQKESLMAVWQKYVGDPAQVEAMLGMVKPSVISTSLSASMASKSLPEFNPMEGIDNTMQKRAAEAGKPVAGLETMDYQIAMLYGTPISAQLKSLLKTVESAEEECTDAIALSDAYKAHDIDKLYELIAKAEWENPEDMERMIFARNDNWVETLSAEMPGTALMVVVGAGHLPGERGVLEGLRKAGFTITPVD